MVGAPVMTEGESVIGEGGAPLPETKTKGLAKECSAWHQLG